MKILLAGLGFKNHHTNYNLNVIIDTICKYSNGVDLIIFGEAFLQGFDSISFCFNEDKEIAITQSDEIIRRIKEKCKENNVGVSFGYYELDGESIYSSQMTISKEGIVINNYHRVSPGWKENEVSSNYKEGKEFSTFNYLGKTICIALCGDLWYVDNIKKIKDLNADIVLWPVYCDYDPDEWNEEFKYDYKEEVKEIGNVLLVNSYCLDNNNQELAKGGCCHFKDGKIKEEIKAGIEGVLVVEIQ